MRFIRAKPKPQTAVINGQKISVGADETLLHAALREGLAFPNSCRVGGCGSCKCNLVRGDVKESTETGYLLTDTELDQHYILACQNRLRSDVTIEADMAESFARSVVGGMVVGQMRLTHDITQLDIQLDTPMEYRAGQFADLSLHTLAGTTRS
jgi:3-phenylpropionate/trans-cinnamate dioxygenase ferredoxin reductase subunit